MYKDEKEYKVTLNFYSGYDALNLALLLQDLGSFASNNFEKGTNFNVSGFLYDIAEQLKKEVREHYD